MTREEIKDFCDMKVQLEPENEDIYKAIAKALEQEPKWIPVTERLPEEGTFVLASYNSDEGTDVIMTYYNKYGFTRGLMTAWMPLPQPYKAESEDKEWQSVNL